MKIPFVKILIVAFLVFSVCSGILIYKNLPRSARQNLVSRLARNKYFQTGAKITTDKINVSAGVVPHHLLARNLIDDFFNYISTREKPETIVLLSPDHFNAEHIIGGRFITIQPETQEFYGMKIDDPLISNLASNNNIAFNNSSINLDHGITNLMPFIKKYFPEAKIIPFIISSNSTLKETGQFSDSLNSLTPLKTIVIASVDFSHYLSSSAAKFHDIKSIRTLIDFEKENFEKLEVDSWQSLYIARFFANFR